MVVWYIISSVFSLIAFFEDHKNGFFYELTPVWIYKHYKLGLGKTIILSSLMAFFFPLYYILWFIYWILHIGRDK